jgi:hypothetical protein
MQTITTAELRDAFAAKIRGITPTHEPLRSAAWSWTPSPRRGGRAVLEPGLRNFDLVFGAGVPSYDWVGGIGTSYRVRVAVATSYAGVEPELLEHMLTQDAVDLWRALLQLRDPTLPGLSHVEPVGLQNAEVDSEANVRVEHVFTISYHQATAS